MGFGIPVGAWIASRATRLGREPALERRLKSDGLFDSILVRARWMSTLQGFRNWQDDLWGVSDVPGVDRSSKTEF